jgi:hypothetical protein
MLDAELGFHPKHERVISGEVSTQRGWDGEFGPFFEKVGSQTYVNYSDFTRSDYVSHAVQGHISVALTAEIQSAELIRRHQALNCCEQLLGDASPVHLVVVRRIVDWPLFGPGRRELVGGGFLMIFAEMVDDPDSTSDKTRLRRRVQRRHTCQVGSNGIAYRRGGAAFTFHAF